MAIIGAVVNSLKDVVVSLATPVIFLLETVFGFLAYLILCFIALISDGFVYLLNMDASLEELFGFDYHYFYKPIITISGMFLILLIFFDIVKALSSIEDVEIKTPGEYFKRIIMSFVLLTVLPVVVDIFQVSSDYFCLFCDKIFKIILQTNTGITNENSAFDTLINAAQYLNNTAINVNDGGTSEMAKYVMILVFLIAFIIGFILVGISLMKRYVELLIAVLFIPYIATTVYQNYDKLNAWMMNVAKTFLGYMLNVFLVYVLLLLSVTILTATIERLFVNLLLFIAVISVAISGPQTIKEYIISTGTGQQATGTARSITTAIQYSRFK